MIRLQGAGFSGRAFVARGDNYPDALAASPLAAAWRAPIILARPGTVAPALPSQVTRVTILGQADVVSAGIESTLKTQLGASNVSRLGGATRYETAAMIAGAGVTGGLSWNGVGITTGENFPDALGGSALAGAVGGPLLLVRATAIPEVTRAEIRRLGANMVYVLGGSGAIEDVVVAELRAMLGNDNVKQLEGPTRYETAAKVAEEVIGHEGFDGLAFIARGDNYPDALAA